MDKVDFLWLIYTLVLIGLILAYASSERDDDE